MAMAEEGGVGGVGGSKDSEEVVANGSTGAGALGGGAAETLAVGVWD